MRRRTAGLLVGAVALLSACGQGAPGLNATAPPAGPPAAAASPAPVPSALRPVPSSSPARVTVVPVPAPGSLALASVPLAEQRLSLDVAFGGLPVGPPTAAGQRVVYPKLSVTAGRDGALVAHVKLPWFLCPAGTDPSRISREECTGRRVVYADADASGTRVTVDADDRVTVEVEALGYQYRNGVDRAPRLVPRPNGERVRLRLQAQSGAVLERSGGALVWRPLASISLGDSPATAKQDDGYANRYRVVLGAR